VFLLKWKHDVQKLRQSYDRITVLCMVEEICLTAQELRMPLKYLELSVLRAKWGDCVSGRTPHVFKGSVAMGPKRRSGLVSESH
jgi:hypothetical protein